MEPDKNLKEEQHTEELPIVEDVVYHHENEEDTLDEPVEKPVRMTPITVDLDDAEKDDIHIGMSQKKAETKKEEPETNTYFQKLRAYSDFALEVPYNPSKIAADMKAILESLSDEQLHNLTEQIDHLEEDITRYCG